MTETRVLPRGVFTISIDFELIWGTLDKPKWKRSRRLCLRERARVIDALLDLFAEFQVSASWCTVGHLFLDSCTGRHPEIAPTENSAKQLERDPGSNVRADPVFYGPELIEKILSCPTRQEIGSHSFTHVMFTECSRETASSELAACKAEAGRMGIVLRAFAFPRNRIGHLDLLPRHGFEVFRGRDACWHEQAPRRTWRHKVGHVWDIARAAAPPTVVPVAHEGGLWEIPGSMLYTPSHGVRALVPGWLRVSRAAKGLEAAARDRRIFHLWFHPTDFAARPEMMLRGLRRILEIADELRQAGALSVLPMGAIADWLNGQAPEPAALHGSPA